LRPFVEVPQVSQGRRQYRSLRELLADFSANDRRIASSSRSPSLLPWYVVLPVPYADLVEINKVRTFFRMIFAVGLLTLGADGLTKDAKVNRNA
jgi:hypothetical protein